MIKFYNTLTRQLEDFVPIKKDKVFMYSCGPTVYNYAHIGNLRSYIFEDILKRTLLFNGYKVKNVINITDVGHLTDDADTGEDKLEKAASLQKKSAGEIAEFFTKAFKHDLQELNILEPTIWAKATDHIKDQIKLIKVLDKKGYLYKTSDGLYFDTSKFADYGKLANLNLAGQQEGARVEVNKEKRNPSDFAVWKFSNSATKRQQEWDSPWGVGFPGWHLECSAMSMKYLGENYDIHTGGIDHIPVHHTNEIAQSQCATDKKYVNYWLHNEFLIMNDQKMAKSSGNFMTLADLQAKGYEPLVYRYFNLTAHYRSKLNFSFEAMDGAKSSLAKLRQKYLELGGGTGEIDQTYLGKFLSAINDDLNTPQALAVVWEMLKSDLVNKAKKTTLLEFDKVLGLDLKDYQEVKLQIPNDIKDLAEARWQAKVKKDFELADKLRQELKDKGYEVVDMADKYEIKQI